MAVEDVDTVPPVQKLMAGVRMKNLRLGSAPSVSLLIDPHFCRFSEKIVEKCDSGSCLIMRNGRAKGLIFFIQRILYPTLRGQTRQICSMIHFLAVHN